MTYFVCILTTCWGQQIHKEWHCAINNLLQDDAKTVHISLLWPMWWPLGLWESQDLRGRPQEFLILLIFAVIGGLAMFEEMQAKGCEFDLPSAVNQAGGATEVTVWLEGGAM